MAKAKKKKQDRMAIKPRTLELGEALARKIFKLQHNEPTINDVVERLIVLEAYKYGLLNEQEHRQVLEFYGMSVVPEPTEVMFVPTAKEESRQERSKGIPKGLPLGNITLEDN